jgi:hypothetical protein
MAQFPRRDVERSFRKFNDIVSDLFNAKFQTWGDAFAHLMTHCEEDPVMRIVTEPLRLNKHVDAGKWLADASASVGSMVGSGRYELPYDDDDRTALLYQFCLKIANEHLDISRFCVHFYGLTNFQEMTDTLNRELIHKFTREVSYRLDEILQDIGTQTTVSREAMLVFHYHDQSTTINGNIQGSNVATSGASISDTSASFDSLPELATAFQSLTLLVRDLSDSQRTTAEQAIAALVDAATSGGRSTTDVASAATAVSNASPALARRLREIAGRIGTSLVASSIFQGIKMAVGLP